MPGSHQSSLLNGCPWVREWVTSKANDWTRVHERVLPLCNVNSVSCGSNVKNINSEFSVNCVNSVQAVYSTMLPSSLMVFFDTANLALTNWYKKQCSLPVIWSMSLSIKKTVNGGSGKSNTISVWTLSLPYQPAGGDRAASEDMVPKPENKGGFPEYFC